MKGVANVVIVAVLASLTLLIIISSTLWFKGLVAQYMRDTSIKLYVTPLRAYTNGTLELYLRNYGRDLIIDSIVVNGKYEAIPYKVITLQKLNREATLGNDNTLIIPQGASVKLLIKVRGIKPKTGVTYELTIHSIDGAIYISNIELSTVIDNVPKGSSKNSKLGNLPWLCSNLRHRIVINVTSLYDRINYLIPIRINLTKLGFIEYLNESTVEVRNGGKVLQYSITRVSNNTYWLVINTSLIKDKPETIEIYFNTSVTPDTLGRHYGNLTYVFPLPCGYTSLGSNYVLSHVQIDNLSNQQYVLLMGKYPIFKEGLIITSKSFSSSASYYVDTLNFKFPYYGKAYNTLYISKYFRVDTSEWQKKPPVSVYVGEDEFVNHEVIATGWTYEPEYLGGSIKLNIMCGEDHGLTFREYVWSYGTTLESKLWITNSGDLVMNIRTQTLSYVVAGISAGEGTSGNWLAFMTSTYFTTPEFFSLTSYSCPKVTYSLSSTNVCDSPTPAALSNYYFLIFNLGSINYEVIGTS